MPESIIKDSLTFSAAAICTAFSLGLGLLLALAYRFKNRPSKNFLIALLLIPSLVQAVIMMVNGNIGTGVAVLGAFSLVRFRSFPGNAKDICFIFFGMAVGIATGIGQIWFALCFAVLICIIFLAAQAFGERKEKSPVREKELKITFPEDFDFETEMTGILSAYADTFEMFKIKTSNMGSLFTVDYFVRLKKDVSEKKMIDEIRIRNGNLPIVCVNRRSAAEEL
ncbi:MAG: DUF4956 domain-containing protein [Clostridiales bacterium]|jgi:predicted membrane protein|nr:DUF4956 domain-containing protein [Clostridiales bacterium]